MTSTDLFLTLLSIIGFLWVVLRLAVTVIPLQVKEARVVNGLAKLRRQLLISGVSIMAVALVGDVILTVAIYVPHGRLYLEALILIMVGLLIIVAETKHAIYHQQYSVEHKELSKRVAQAMEREDRKSQRTTKGVK